MPTRDNVARVGKTICAVRAAACREATALLPDTEDETAAWVDDALADDALFAFEQVAPPARLQHSAAERWIAA